MDEVPLGKPVDTPQREENESGTFFVDDRCISCAACWKAAPDHFKSHEIHTYAYVCHQPNSDSELLKCKVALELCPVQAIGRKFENV